MFPQLLENIIQTEIDIPFGGGLRQPIGFNSEDLILLANRGKYGRKFGSIE